VGDRVPVFGPSGGYVGHYPANRAAFVKATNDWECRTLKGRGGHWYTPQELQAMQDRVLRAEAAFLNSLT
jgi:hypothetical protein